MVSHGFDKSNADRVIDAYLELRISPLRHEWSLQGQEPDVLKLKEQQGIGDVTAWVLRAYVGDFSRFKTAKQLARYCGMSPCNASSGKRQADAGLIDGCNKLLRLTVVQAAHRLIRTCQRWSDLAESMRARGKPACVIVGAVGNRWLRNLHHAMKMDAQPTDQKGAIGN